MDETAARGRAARLVAVLAVLLGLLVMHGVASAHHAAASPVGRDVLPATGPAAAQADGPRSHHATTAETTPVTQQDAALAAPTGRSCHDDCPSVAALCVAVLTCAALALLLARRRACPVGLAPTRDLARAPAPPIRHARGPDLVRELCVSRT